MRLGRGLGGCPAHGGGDMVIVDRQKPVDHSLKGTSSWLRVVREEAGAPAKAKKSA